MKIRTSKIIFMQISLISEKTSRVLEHRLIKPGRKVLFLKTNNIIYVNFDVFELKHTGFVQYITQFSCFFSRLLFIMTLII